jgi:prepilin signal peptidase PulO-like enzyme (type II secretory pathway)
VAMTPQRRHNLATYIATLAVAVVFTGVLAIFVPALRGPWGAAVLGGVITLCLPAVRGIGGRGG